MPFILLKCGAIQVPIPLFLQVDYAFSHQEMYSNSKLRFKRSYRLFVSTLYIRFVMHYMRIPNIIRD